MKVGFPLALEPIQGIPTLQSLIELLSQPCCCTQMQRSPASATMNLLFCAAPPDVYAFLTAEAYPAAFAHFLPIVPDVPNYTACTNENKRATVKAMHRIDKKTRVDILTMNTALANVFLEALSLQVRTSFQQWQLCKLNIVFINMIVWFIFHYGKTKAEDFKANRQCMAADWHPTNGFDTLVLCLFTSVAFAGCTNFTMADCNIVDIGLCVIKRCGMYAKEFKGCIACEAIRPRNVKLLTPSRHSGRQRSPWSTRPPSLPVNTLTGWLPPTMATLLSCMANLLQTLVPHMPPPKNQSNCRAQQLC